MKQRGFGLLMLIIAVGIMLIIAGGGFSFSRSGGQKSMIQQGNEAIQQAEAAKKALELLNKQLGEGVPE
jgi:type II secretory pathway component PulJ